MSEFSTFSAGVADAESDFLAGAVSAGGPTETATFPTLDYIVNEFRLRLNCSDEYLAGYLSVVFSR